jgi:hypothetical protein
MEEEHEYRIRVAFTSTVKGRDQGDALATVALGLRHLFFAVDVRDLEAKVIRQLHSHEYSSVTEAAPETEQPRVVEAPKAAESADGVPF